MTNPVSGTGTAEVNPDEVKQPSAAATSVDRSLTGDSVSLHDNNGTNHRRNDKIFKFLTTGSAVTITVIIALIGIFLLWRAVPSLMRNSGGIAGFFTFGGNWDLHDTSNMTFGIPNLFAVTVLVSMVALAMAMPVALGVALFLAAYCPKSLVRPLGFLVDLLAAVPSIVYGLWGMAVVGPTLGPAYAWIADHVGGIPVLATLFAHGTNSPSFATSRNIITGGVVLAIMILPVIAATAREVFVQTPKGHVESALALGATKWEVVRLTVLPFGLSGFISGSMLGLGRALGETMALYLVIASAPQFRWSLLDGGTTFATSIANAAPEFNDDLKAGAYIASGLVLFILTFFVNAGARAAIKRKNK